MTLLYWVGLAVTSGLFIYLIWALFRPEDFS